VLRFFHPHLRPGEFIVTEDGIISDLVNDPDCNSGPHRALKEFLQLHPGEYDIAGEYCDFFGYNLTWCTNGWLRKTVASPTTALDDAAMSALRRRLEAGDVAAVFKDLNQLKARRCPVRGTDLLRAQCFLRLGQPQSAIEALKEELRYFADNEEAAALLAHLQAEHGAKASGLGNAEFQELLRVVLPYTMLSEARLHSLYELARQACRHDLPGNFVECGVAAGGSSALLAAVIARHSQRPRKLFACDSFEGLPVTGEMDTHDGQDAESAGWGAGTCAAPVNSLLEVCRKLGVESVVEPITGYFADTLPANRARFGCIALLHMDGDWYSSTRDILTNLYDAVVEGGAVQIDDYGFWEGCQRAVSDFAQQRGIWLDLRAIDGTGVWFTKRTVGATANAKPLLVNLGCGRHFHPDWVNLDLTAHAPGVIPHDLRDRLPFADACCDVVYHSHVLEHFTRPAAATFLRECHRVLKPGGTLRVVVPDLETIARLYLHYLDRALAGDPRAAERYDWMTLELLDQMVRQQGGGEMLRYWQSDPMPAEDFVVERVGAEVQRFLEWWRAQPPAPPAAPAEPSAEEQVRFRQSGEVHKWMYDRWSLKNLLTACGLTDVRPCAAHESRIPDFDRYQLDVEPGGSTRKPDSLFMEAVKPVV